jgi:hypothetical protein
MSGTTTYQESWCKTVAQGTGAKFSMAIGGAVSILQTTSPWSLSFSNDFGPVGTSDDVTTMIAFAGGSAGPSGAGWLRWVEGVSEPNLNSIAVGVTDQIQQGIGSGIASIGAMAHPITIIGPSIAFTIPKPDTTITAYASAVDIATLTANSTFCNAHIYPPTNPDWDDGSGRSGVMHDVSVGMTNAFGPQPIMCTEWHPTLKNTQGVTQSTLQALYEPYYATIFCLAAFREGLQGWFWRSLFDFGTTQCGLFPTNATNPRNSAYAIRAMYSLTGDKGATKLSFTPGLLNYTITGLPSAQPGAPFTGGQTALFQNSAGTFFLYVWNSQNAPGGTASQITLTFGTTMTSVAEYNLTGGAPTTPVQTKTAVKSLTSSLNASVHLFVIQYPGTPAPGNGESPNDTIIVTGDSKVITDAAGNIWGINASGQVTVGGTADSTTSGITEIAYVNGLVWKWAPTAGQWSSKSSPSGSWSAPTTLSPLPASANDAIISLGSNHNITDAAGNTWGLTSSTLNGAVTYNGSTDTTTANVQYLAYVNGSIWQFVPSAGLWWQATATPPNGSWQPGAGTPISPLPAGTQLPPLGGFSDGGSGSGGGFTPSPDQTVVLAGSSQVITDSQGFLWGINSSGQVTINGQPDTATSGVGEIAYVSGSVWEFVPALNKWWFKTSPTGVWSPTGGTPTSPLQTTGGTGGTGPAASSTFATVEFNTQVRMPNNSGPVVIQREMFGIATAAALDFNFSVMNNTTFQSTSRSLTIPLVRFNCNSGSTGGNIFSNTFPGGVHGTPNWNVWDNFINNIGKCVDLTTTKIIMGVGFPDTGGLSNSDFASMTTQVMNRLRTTSPAGGGSPIDPKIWEYLNEPSTVSSSGFNAFIDAVNGVAAGYTCTGPAGANDFGLLDTLVNGAGGRSFMGNEHAYLYCQGPDQKPSTTNIAQAIPVTGTSPGGFASAINGHCDGHSVVNGPFFFGEWSIECGAASVAEEQNIVGALFGASNLFKCAVAINRPLWGGYWEWVNDGTYGIIQGSSIAPVGYFLSKATQKMPGTMVSTALGGAAPNMAGWSTQSATAGNFGVYLHNWGGSAQSGQVALSHVPTSSAINASGNGTATLWTQSGSTPAGGSVTSVSVTNGLTSSITVPAMGQVIISVP